ncbi:MAG: GNAT family N-acetyltransferase [Campylobacteraceae bacterium]
MLRYANLEDLKALCEIESELFNENNFPLSRESFRYHIKHKAIFVYEKDSNPVGSVLVLFRTNSKTARIYSLGIKNAFQGLGIAKILFEKALLHVKENGKDFAKLEVRVDNQKAIKMYEKYGFTCKRVLKEYYLDKCDGLEMFKTL